MNYPNLVEIITYHPYHVSTFADFANVSGELLQEVLKGNEELLPEELDNIARYTRIPVSVLKCSKLIMLDRDRFRHRLMVKELLGKLKYIRNCQESGSHEADNFMRYDRQYLEQFKYMFLHGRGTYGQYIGARKYVNQCLSFINSEQRKKKVRTVSKRGIL